MRRADGPSCEDHLSAATCAAQFAVLPPAHAGRALAVQFQALHEAFRFEPQVLAVQHRLEESARRRPPAPPLLIDVEVTDALVVAGVEIPAVRNPVLVCPRAEPIKDFPGQTRIFAPPFAACGVVLAFEKMINVLAKVWPHVVP